MPVVGFLNTASPAPFNHLVAAFRSGLEEAGFVEGRNVALEFRWADGRYERLPALAAELVQRSVAVLATSGGDPALLAARAATTTIPIVFLIGSDPVELGYVASVHQLTAMLGAKRLGLLREVAPRAALMGVLINPSFPPAAAMLKDAEKAAASLGIRVLALNATTESEFRTGFQYLGS
ncbi:MAG: ABC transporter substrate binding protein [Xanthobacteraceae bacterium]